MGCCQRIAHEKFFWIRRRTRNQSKRERSVIRIIRLDFDARAADSSINDAHNSERVLK